MKLHALGLGLCLSVGGVAWANPGAAAPPAPQVGDAALLTKKTNAIVGAMLDGHASEARQARVYHRLSTPEIGDVSIAMFTLEGMGGGVHYQSHLALFGSAESRFNFLDVVKVGEKGWRHVDFLSASAHGAFIVLETLGYADDDALCCPSRKGQMRLRVSNGRMTELGTKP